MANLSHQKGKKMKHRIFTLSQHALDEDMRREEAIYQGEIETVKEFDDFDETEEYFEEGGFDTDYYGYE